MKRFTAWLANWCLDNGWGTLLWLNLMFGVANIIMEQWRFAACSFTAVGVLIVIGWYTGKL